MDHQAKRKQRKWDVHPETLQAVWFWLWYCGWGRAMDKAKRSVPARSRGWGMKRSGTGGFLKILILIRCVRVCVCMSCGHVHVCAGVLLCAGAHWGQRHGIPLDLDFHQSWATLWVVRTELWSYWRAVSAQNLWAILPAPHWGIFKDSIWGRNCDCISQSIVTHAGYRAQEWTLLGVVDFGE